MTLVPHRMSIGERPLRIPINKQVSTLLTICSPSTNKYRELDAESSIHQFLEGGGSSLQRARQSIPTPEFEVLLSFVFQKWKIKNQHTK